MGRGGGGARACASEGGSPHNCYRKSVFFTELALPHDWDHLEDNRIMVQNNAGARAERVRVTQDFFGGLRKEGGSCFELKNG